MSEVFDELSKSIEEAGAIHRGEMLPARMTCFAGKEVLALSKHEAQEAVTRMTIDFGSGQVALETVAKKKVKIPILATGRSKEDLANSRLSDDGKEIVFREGSLLVKELLKEAK
jgi:hypothetical protein